ncbi:hypothetical protein TVAG_281390 [Trichomonas vaginalis G3]|uniref:Uncharacterized protein n=1 Tax=Trichomonas vaginalis (strain ATCC PRA-98 / G3) TaxID=412133 RepID=A2F963_TRIV3|nr:hypothetical protein TVAGG3_0236560 [Trichomonas vaginalis G3]EAX98541.1 hypothetical protein TVAG_281390 [Trichomonas vaginalis G3]KAI5553038.1 hypothetical protein TVAGG3_0236560 [Trichomonas vaginalis G3]|eukprot:XP_001311471.1 hypothetical protein [Trichomonas vaginalis G3]
MAAADQEDTKAVSTAPPLEDFVPVPPTIKFYNYQRLNNTSKNLRKLHEEMMNYKPSDNPTTVLKYHKKQAPTEEFTEENDNTQPEQIDSVSSDILECIPPFAPAFEEKIELENPELKKILREQAIDRFNTAEEYQKQETILLSNYYDAQIRENVQKNDQVDKRPISDALRYLSKRISYPSEYTVQRFYKYNFRYEKISKKHKKALGQLHATQDQRTECLYQSQIQEIVSFGEYNKIELPEFKIQKLPVNTITE